jgi:hypothetical protein
MKQPSSLLLSDGDAAREETRNQAIQILREGFSLGEDRRRLAITVCDEDGNIVFHGTLNEAAGLPAYRLLN